MTNKPDYTDFQACRALFAQRDTAGFYADIMALQHHITQLTQLAPKDKANWPLPSALNVIEKLQLEHARALNYLNIVTNQRTSPSD